MKIYGLAIVAGLTLLSTLAWAGGYPIVDTGQQACFDNSHQIGCPEPGEKFNGQDSQYKGSQARYVDNGDGTVSDLVTGLMWVQARGDKTSWQQAMAGAQACRVGGYDDWRAPSIKELYSLIDFNGWVQKSERTSKAFIDTRYFKFKFGDQRAGERIIDCQDWSATEYLGTTMGGSATIFGVNFADGRIKGYPKQGRGTRHNKYIRYVRGNPAYGQNDFTTNGSGTVTDAATGLIWQQRDSGTALNWEQALSYCENLDFAGRDDWRLPSAKELQSIVDYKRSPTATDSAAIDPVFYITQTESYFWTSTTHLDGPKPSHAVYVAFGRAMGYFAPPRSSTAKRFMDVHGAGAQRSDPKSGDPSRYPQGHGPQGDDIRIYNSVRCVTGGQVEYYEPANKNVGRWKGGRGNPNMQQGSNLSNGPGSGRQQGMNGGPQGMRRRQGPPQQAVDACSGASDGSECSFRTPRGTLSGICRNMGDQTACVPEGGPSR